MNRQLPRIMVFTPSGRAGLRLAVAAGRAGALGMLDLREVPGGEAIAILAEAARLAGGPLGVRLAADASPELDWEALPDRIGVVAWSGGDEPGWPVVVGRARRRGRLVVAEVATREEAARAGAAGVDGRIVSGHEAGGVCSEESSFILLQGVLADGGPPAWVRGGIGPLAASACLAAGTSGVVLDGALLLARESPLDDEARGRIARLDGGETVALGPPDGPIVRVFAPPGSPALARLREAAEAGGEVWRLALRRDVGWGVGRAWPIGQDAAHAAGLARRGVTVGGIVRATEEAIDRGIELARSVRPLAPGSPLAASHGTAYPIVQGPMTRVSDTSAFAAAVAEAGGLPLLALAMAEGAGVRRLLAEAAGRLGRRPWGVGLLGFLGPELLAEQLAEVRAARPPFALIAGGRPDQAEELERGGIATYLHAPSPGLLEQFVRAGARRFVLEGRECGGHVGPRSSLVLWEQAVGALTSAVEAGRVADASELHVLFAGGIHDARSAAAVSVLAAPLAARGAKVGVLVGTAYLFTREATETGAIVPRFQREALGCRRTVLLKTAPGHEVRVAPSPYVEAFEAERRRLRAGGASPEAARDALERLNVGRLRVAAKGVDRDGAGSPLIAVDESRQYESGLYMLGQVAPLRDRLVSMSDLHCDISEGGTARLGEPAARSEPRDRARPSDVAIVGMAAIFPGAADLAAFRENALRGVDAIVEVPPDRWDWRPYYDPDPKAPDKVVSKWGGFLPDVPFDPLHYGMPPTSLTSIEPAQLLVLEAVRSALADAGYSERPFPRERTAVVLGMGGGAAQLAMGYAFRSYLPMLESVAPEAGREARRRAEAVLPEWTEDSFPGFLLNVTAGRVANRFDLGGANYTVDAACGSSLAAAALAVRELEAGAADMVILGGADTVQNPFTYLAFSKTHAFSPRGRCRPFDASADGIVISEGVGVVVLKRLADARRDGDRIYAVIKGIGCSSDGRARGLTAPCGEGQARALERAYAKAGVDPTTVGYFEAHGTGTPVGDAVEVDALAGFLRARGAAEASCAVGSVKSMIGHTKCAAGLAGLIQASLALHHRVLPPTIGVERLNPGADLDGGPLRVNTRLRPWLHSADAPRRAGVSAFGFGGTNFHAVLEADDLDPEPPSPPLRDWPAELFVWHAETPERLVGEIDRLVHALDGGARPAPRDLAHTLAARHVLDGPPGPTLAIVAGSLDDLRRKLGSAREAIAAGQAEWNDPRGAYFAARPAFPGARFGLLFPGQGAQSLEMLGDLAIAFDEVRGTFDAFDAALVAGGLPAIGPRVFPPTTFDDAAREQARHALMATDVAQPAIGAASAGMLRLLATLGIRPDAVAGHSYGELVALHAAGSLDADGLAILSQARGHLMAEAAGHDPGAMAALMAGPDRVSSLLSDVPGVVVANFNGPRQTVVSGSRDAVGAAVERARAEGIRAFDLPVACAFHSPHVAGAREPLAHRAADFLVRPPSIPVYANLDAVPHPADPEAIARRLGDALVSPVRFAEAVESMHADGVRVFVECGPGATLAPLVGTILGDRPHLAVSCDAPGRPGVPTLLHALARLVAAGTRVDPRRLTAGRDARRLDLAKLPTTDRDPLPPSTWLVNGSRARPIAAPEPRRLGQAMAPPEAPPGSEAEVTSHSERNGHASRPLADAPDFPDGHLRNGHVPRPATGPRLLPVSEASGRNRIMASHPDQAEDPVPLADRREGPSGPPHAGRNGHESARRRPSAGGVSERVIESFQETMRLFLDVQQETMLAYLAGRGSPDAEPSEPHAGPSPERIAPELPEREVAPEPARTEVAPPPAVIEATPPEGSIAGRLVEIVCERTGYPAEMLDLGLDLEADLGIDSIKRVEILGTLRETVAGLDDAADSSLMDGLTRARTLGEIVERVGSALAGRRTAAAADPTPAGGVPGCSSLRRLRIEVIEAPRPPDRLGLVPGGGVLVTDDGRGVAAVLADRLRSEGHPVEVVDAGGLVGASRDEVAALVGRAFGDRPLAGLVHALPLRDAPHAELDPRAWSARIESELRSLFLLAGAAGEGLDRSARRGGACLVAATAMGGAFGSAGPLPEAFFPGQGGIAGLVKTLAREWPIVRARVVDLDPSEGAERLAECLAAEALTDDVWPEVGYRGGHRIRLRSVEAPLAAAGPGLHLEPGAPVVLTGGGRGITAAVAVAMARRWRPTLLLVGSGVPPSDAEDAATAGLTSAPELKSALLETLRREGRAVGPADVERAYRAVLYARQVRETLRQAREAGAAAEYARADVRDAGALGRVLDGWRARHGEPVGLVHGAGVIHDKLLRDKTPESFDRVLGTKLGGALNLARLLRPEALRFAVLFSSIAGRFGNRGQSDYAAANEALSKLALWLDRRWPGRVLSVGWGPWSRVGMVSDLEGHLSRRGLGMIEPEDGCAALIDEICRGAKGDVEVLLASGLGALDGPLPIARPGLAEVAG